MMIKMSLGARLMNRRMGADQLRRPRGGSRGSRRTREAPRRIGALYGWWRADSGITLNGATVSAWADKTTGKVLAQGTAASQPTYVASDAAFANRECLSLDDGDRLTSNLAASAWSFLHDGTGGTVVQCLLVDPADSVAGLCGTTWSSAGRTGISVLHLAAWRFAVLNGVTQAVVTPARPVIGSTIWFAYGVTPTNIVRQTSGVAYGASAHGIALSSGAPHTPFTIGNEGSDGNAMRGKIAETIVYSGMLSSAEMASLGAYFVARYGALA